MIRRFQVTAWVAACAGALALAGCAVEPRSDRDWTDLRRWEDTRTLAGDSLAALLGEPDRDLRAAAARALGRVGHGEALHPLLRALREDGTEEVRREAAFALGILGHPDAVETLVLRLDSEPDVEATAEICLALGRIGREGTATFLHPMLRSDYPRIREAAAEALALLADSTSVAPLVRATHDSVPTVVWRATYALEKVPDPSSHDRLLALTAHQDELVRRYAIRSLGRIGATTMADTVARLSDPRPGAWQERVRVADTLGRLGVLSPTVRSTVQRLLVDRNFHVRVAALQAIARAQWTELAAPVVAMAGDPTVDVRAARIETLGAIDRDAYAAEIAASLTDSSAIVVATTITQVGARGNGAGLERMETYLAADQPRAFRMAAAQGLAEAGDAVPRERIEALLGDEDVFVATIAATALGERGDPAAADALLRASERTGDPTGEFHRAVYGALGAIGAEVAIPRLRRALDEDTSTWCRLAARDALRALLDGPARAALPTEEGIRLSPRPIERDPAQPPLVRASRALEIRLDTRHGTIVIRTFGEDAPQMVESFARLAQSGFFDGLTFHRVVPDFVVQGGDPTGTGWGDAGYTLRSEWNRRPYERGAVGIAHSGKDTGSCQLFVTHSPQPHLDARYTVWGEVVDGTSVVDRIERGDTFTATVHWGDPID